MTTGMSGAVRNGAVSFWYALTATPGRRPPLQGDREADVCIVGGGFTGLWTAYYLKRARPELEIVVLEREFAGFGASGRNGGWLSSAFNGSPAAMAGVHGREAVLDLRRAMQETVDEVLAVCAAEAIDADAVKGGMLLVARGPAQAARLAAELPGEREWLPAPGDLVELDRDALAARVRVAGALGGVWSPHAARVQPAKLVQGLAAAVERLGVRIFEGTTVTEIRARTALTDRGTVRAQYVLSCLEGFTASLRGQRRTWLPLNSAMIATESLSDADWSAIGWDGAEVLGDGAHAYMYAQRTADGRIALGGRGVPYRFGSRTDHDGQAQARTTRQLIGLLHDLFPATRDARIDHTWCGVLGVPRDWSPTVRLDAATGLGMAGGYVGNGVATTNLAGRTLCDLVLGRDTRLTGLPWVGRSARRWEPEPLRWIGAQLVYALYRAADRREAARGTAETSRLAKVASALSGR
ncbi:MAG TPA: FAD-binding oxidoreductase [Baekduia sp.]|jgi:glycine/D-amino acid oxidase-like deaminating enzyme